MKNGILATALVVFGGAVTAGAKFWWHSSFGDFVNESGRDWMDVVPCLYWSGSVCDAGAALVQLGGGTPYSPISFWVGVIAMVSGVILLITPRD